MNVTTVAVARCRFSTRRGSWSVWSITRVSPVQGALMEVPVVKALLGTLHRQQCLCSTQCGLPRSPAPLADSDPPSRLPRLLRHPTHDARCPASDPREVARPGRPELHHARASPQTMQFAGHRSCFVARRRSWCIPDESQYSIFLLAAPAHVTFRIGPGAGCCSSAMPQRAHPSLNIRIRRGCSNSATPSPITLVQHAE